MPSTHRQPLVASQPPKPITNATSRETKPTTWNRIRKRFGILEIITFISSIVLTITVVVLLLLLWYMGYTAESSASKNMIAVLAVRDWLPQFITILTAVLRFSVSAQALICCMMLASLALRSHAVRKPDDRHAVVLLQETGPGPSALLLPFARAAIRRRFVSGSVLATLLFVLLALAQFLSTILLSDFRPANLVSESRTLAVNMSNGDLGVDSSVMMAVRPVTYPIFAEDLEGRNKIPSTGSARGLFDTGNTSRAYIPLSDNDRTRVSRYDGFGTVLTTHTICFPLDLSNITIVDLYRQTNLNNPEPKGNDSSWNAEFAFRGTFSPPSSDLYNQYHGGRSFNFDRLSTFNLTGAVADECDSFAIMGLNVCSLGNFPWDVIPEQGRSYNGTGDIDDPDAEWFIITRLEAGQESLASNLSDIVIGRKPAVRYDSEWTTLRFGNETYWLEFHHSLCVNRVIYAQANVSMERFPASSANNNDNMNTKILYEPSVYRRAHMDYTQDETYDLTGVLHQLGVDNNTSTSNTSDPTTADSPTTQVQVLVEERDILHLLTSTALNNRPPGSINASVTISQLFHMQPFNNGPATCISSQEMLHHEPKIYYYNVCPRNGDMADALSMQLFLNAWKLSDSLAMAFEALDAFVFLTLYTPISTRDQAINGGVDKSARVEFLETRLIPRRWAGLGILLGVLVAHWLVLGVVAGRFLGLGRVEVFREEEASLMVFDDVTRMGRSSMGSEGKTRLEGGNGTSNGRGARHKTW